MCGWWFTYQDSIVVVMSSVLRPSGSGGIGKNNVMLQAYVHGQSCVATWDGLTRSEKGIDVVICI